jgi:hypothetical protein
MLCRGFAALGILRHPVWIFAVTDSKLMYLCTYETREGISRPSFYVGVLTLRAEIDLATASSMFK